jgi:histidinol-phosphatase
VGDRELDEAVDLARRAGDLTLRWFRSMDLAVDRKSDGTVVTAADQAAEDLVREHLREHHPDDTVIGEERGTSDGTSGRTWIVDPIDGTAGFVRGVPLYSTLLALCDGDGPVLGVVHLPAVGSTLWAARSGGCFVDGRPCRVSDRVSLDGALLTTSAYETFRPAQMERLLASGAALRTWGDGYGYYLVATGQAEVMVDPVASAWDLAAMPVVIGEAGGRFSALDGTPAFDSGNGVASNGILHDEVLALLDLP